MKDQVCFDCGVKYLTERQKKNGGNVVTFNIGECCKCKQQKSVTSIRHYNYLRQ